MASMIICISSRSWRIRMKDVFSFVSKIFIFFLFLRIRSDIWDMVIYRDWGI